MPQEDRKKERFRLGLDEKSSLKIGILRPDRDESTVGKTLSRD